ncbi:GlxA family transcriptional regulator [Pseudoruegeria sp. HB172150]|uniref:GlxA family transcriptional regulator n=1 Tax=Pseudoruegeria sp. HB172150 TaxID=2721164 RepID=UPI0015566E4E|nr:helix-turn-helix domain-containing protein [Pseudoruegeria sp. HB172150]
MSTSVLIMAPPQASTSSLFGLQDTLMAAGRDWEALVTGEHETPVFDVKLVGPDREPYPCGRSVRIAPEVTFDGPPDCDLVVVPGLELSPWDRPVRADHPGLDWLASLDQARTRIVSACTGAIYLAETGLLDGVEATSHWAFEDVFRRHYPKVRLRLDRGLCFAEADRGPVTSGGTTGWQELALFLIAHYGGARRAARAAKIWLMADRGELQAPFTSMIRATPHEDAPIRAAQIWIADNYTAENPVRGMAARSGLPSTTFARRFRSATGRRPMDYVQAIRIEEARQLLETSPASVAEVGEQVGFEDAAYFRRLFKKRTGLTPAEHRRMFGATRFAHFE